MATLAPLSSPGAGYAHYQHCSTFQYTQAGVFEIARRFREQARQLTADLDGVQLSYDDQDDVFVLACRNNVGFQLDALLGQLLRSFTEQEATLADSDEREPMIRRFAESILVDASDDTVLPVSHLNAGNAIAPAQQATPSASSKHILKMEGTNLYRKAKAFRMGDVPAALRLRARAHDHGFDVSKCVSIRIAHWMEDIQRHIFNSTLGKPLQALSEAQSDGLETLFDLTTFNDFTNPTRALKPKLLEDRPARREAEQQEQDHWEFEGEEPSVQQWLAGMGKTRQVDPSVVPDAAKDAIKFTGGASEHRNTLGRVRMPKGVPFADFNNEDASNSDDEKNGVLQRKDFSALLRRKADTDKDSGDSDSSSTSSDAGGGGGAKTTSFVALMGGTMSHHDSKKTIQADSTGAVTNRPLLQARVQPSTGQQNFTPSMSDHHGHVSSSHKSKDTSSRAEAWPVDDRRYTKIDKLGLAGNAANQARWELENLHLTDHAVASTVKVRTRDELSRHRAGSQASEQSAPTGSASMSISEGRHLFPSQGRQIDLPPVATPTSYDETVLGGAEPWAKNFVTAETPKPPQVLIDIGNSNASGPSRTNKANVPPGFFPPLGSLTQHTSKRAREQRKPQPVQPLSVGHLIDLSGPSLPTNGQRPVTSKPHRAMKLLMPQLSSPPKKLRDGDLEDDEVIERLAPLPTQEPTLRRTMGQRAQKKGKRKPAAQGKAILPVPDPVPPPKEKKVKKPAAPLDLDTQESVGPSRFVQEITALLMGVPVDGASQAMVVHLGLALLDGSTKLTQAKASRRQDLQTQLDSLAADDLRAGFSEARFLRPLARQNVDAAYLLNLPHKLAGVGPGDYKPLGNAFIDFDIDVEILYEVLVVDSSGKSWIVTIDQPQEDEQPGMPIVWSSKDATSSIYMHYALHVWDARVQLEILADSESDTTVSDELLRAAETFAKSFATRNGSHDSLLPGFEACLPDNEGVPVFAVHKVLAKRTYSQRMSIATRKHNNSGHEPGGATTSCKDTDMSADWRVTQVWDLHLCSAAEDSDADILAFAHDEFSMKEQGRIFWEAEMRVGDMSELSKNGTGTDDSAVRIALALNALEKKVDEIVLELDDVGLGRTEPIHTKALARVSKQKQQGGKAKQAKEYVPYW